MKRCLSVFIISLVMLSAVALPSLSTESSVGFQARELSRELSEIGSKLNDAKVREDVRSKNPCEDGTLEVLSSRVESEEDLFFVNQLGMDCRVLLETAYSEAN